MMPECYSTVKEAPARARGSERSADKHHMHVENTYSARSPVLATFHARERRTPVAKLYMWFFDRFVNYMKILKKSFGA